MNHKKVTVVKASGKIAPFDKHKLEASLLRSGANKEVVEEIVQTIISGNVTDSKGNPLPGASVVEVGTSNGTTTDFDGNFKLAVDNENATLEVSFIGFKEIVFDLNLIL